MNKALKWWMTCLIALCLAMPLQAAETVNINTADAATLDRVLLHIGPAKAAAIVAWREAHGPFRSIEDLGEVKGIGPRTLDKNRDRIVLGSSAVPATGASRMQGPASR